MQSGDFVLPGTEIGFTEEFIPGWGTYEENGKIYSALTGTVKFDMKNRRVIVEPRTNRIPEPRVGDIVIGRVVDVKQQFAIVKLIRLINNPRELPGVIYGSIHISKAKPGFVQDLTREFTPGDVVRAKVINTKRQPIALSTVDRNLGVIKAYCSKCNIALVAENFKLRCPNCSAVEHRKIANDYGKGNV